jgi:hypothetical protein
VVKKLERLELALRRPQHFSSAEAKANGLMEELYPLTPGRFGGNGLFHHGRANAQRVADLPWAVLHSLGESLIRSLLPFFL